MAARIAAAAALSGKSLNQWGEETLERAVSGGWGMMVSIWCTVTVILDLISTQILQLLSSQ